MSPINPQPPGLFRKGCGYAFAKPAGQARDHALDCAVQHPLELLSTEFAGESAARAAQLQPCLPTNFSISAAKVPSICHGLSSLHACRDILSGYLIEAQTAPAPPPQILTAVGLLQRTNARRSAARTKANEAEVHIPIRDRTPLTPPFEPQFRSGIQNRGRATKLFS